MDFTHDLKLEPLEDDMSKIQEKLDQLSNKLGEQMSKRARIT